MKLHKPRRAYVTAGPAQWHSLLSQISICLINQFNPDHALLNHVIDRLAAITCAYVTGMCKGNMPIMQRNTANSVLLLCELDQWKPCPNLFIFHIIHWFLEASLKLKHIFTNSVAYVWFCVMLFIM